MLLSKCAHACTHTGEVDKHNSFDVYSESHMLASYNYKTHHKMTSGLQSLAMFWQYLQVGTNAETIK